MLEFWGVLNSSIANWYSGPHSLERTILATPNYGYEKRQKELAKKRKKEDKLKAKAEKKSDFPDDTSDEVTEDLAGDAAPQNGAVDTPPSLWS